MELFLFHNKIAGVVFLLCIPSIGDTSYTALSPHTLLCTANKYILFSNFKESNLTVNGN